MSLVKFYISANTMTDEYYFKCGVKEALKGQTQGFGTFSLFNRFNITSQAESLWNDFKPRIVKTQPVQINGTNFLGSKDELAVIALNLFDNYVTQEHTSNKVTQYLNLALDSLLISKLLVGYQAEKIFLNSCLLKMITDDYNTHESSPLSEQTEELELQCSTEIEV